MSSEKEVTGGSKTNRLIAIARSKCIFAQTDQGVVYAKMKVGDHNEVYAVESNKFKKWLRAVFYIEAKSSISPSTLDEVIATLTAFAQFEGKVQTVHLRRAKHNGKYYVDLCDARWRVVEIDETGWRVVEQSPVWFTRTSSMRELPEPKPGGAFKPVLEVINVPEKYWIILLAWIIESFRPDTNDVGLCIFGTQGAAKSSIQRFLKQLIDPRGGNLRVRPKSREDMFIEAHNGLLLSYENLSQLSADKQDALCTVLTGGEFTTRKLHSNGDEYEIIVKNPVVLNGINNVVTRPDLLDRFICIEVPEIVGRTRQSDTAVLQRFAELKPTVFGAILTRFQRALKELPKVQKEKGLELPRMADFALLGEAVARSLKQEPGWFLEKYARLRKVGIEQALDGDPVGSAIRSRFSKVKTPLTGTVGAVGEELRKHWQQMPGTKNSDWPDSGKAIGGALRRLQPSMRSVGIVIKFGPRVGDGYTCTIKKKAA